MPDLRVRSRRNVTTPVLAAVGLGAVVMISGCRDQAADQRAEVQAQIESLSHDFHLATLAAVSPGDDAFETTRGKLEAITGSLGRLNASDDGLDAAASLLAAAARRQLAGMSLAEAEMLAAVNREAYTALHTQIDTAMRLESLAAGREQIDTRQHRAELAGYRTDAEMALERYSEEMARLDGPISERESRNTAEAREAMRLDQQAGALRREAIQSGPADGLPSVLEALQLERKADRFETEIARREIELQYGLRPEHELAGKRAEFMQARLAEIGSAMEALDRRDAIGTQEVNATRTLVRDFRSRIAETLAVVTENSAGGLADTYARAAGQLEKAASAAGTAARKSGRDGKDPARLAAARAHEQMARLNAMKARDLEAYASVLERLVAAGRALGDTSGLSGTLSATSTAHEEAVAAALAAIDAAKQELEQVNSRDSRAEVDAFKASLDRSRAALSGSGPMAGGGPTGRAGMPGAGGRGGAGAAAGAAGGFASPEDLVAMLAAVTADDTGSLGRVLDAVHASTPEVQTIIDLQRQLLGPMGEFMSAIGDRFGQESTQMVSSMSSGMGATAFDDAQIVDRTDTTAAVTFSAPMKPNQRIELVLLDGGWKIDGASLYPDLGPAMVAQAETMVPGMARMMSDLAARISSGEFADEQELMQAFMGGMMEAAGGAAGGPGGGVPSGAMLPPDK
jgi:hypothetical protein